MVIVMVVLAAPIAVLAVAVLALLLIGQWGQVLVVGSVTMGDTVVEVNLVVDMGIMPVANLVIEEMAHLATLVDLVLMVEALEVDMVVG